jgi:transcriptional regulator with XRE-family HTH domain
LRTARERKGWTQEQLEAETARRGHKVPQAVISRLENNSQQAMFETVAALAEALEMDPRALRFGPLRKARPEEAEATAP